MLLCKSTSQQDTAAVKCKVARYLMNCERGVCCVAGGQTGTGSPLGGSQTVSPKKDDGKKKLQQFMHNARKVGPV